MHLSLPVILLSSQLVAVADEVPALNMTPTCSAAGAAGVIAGRTTESCLRDEADARHQLQQQWSQYLAADRTRCAQSTSMGGVPSYVELLTCLEMAKAARDLPDETVGRAAPAPR